MSIRVSTPILIIGFNRPNKLMKVLDSALQHSTNVFVALDGPRRDNPQDLALVNECRNIVKSRPYFSTVRVNLLSDNVGCKIRMQTALDWFFSIVDEGIILEDDIVLSREFIDFCTDKLNKYRFDNNVLSISGWNPIFFDQTPGFLFHNNFFISSIPKTWGWATWGDRWLVSKRDIVFSDLLLNDLSFTSQNFFQNFTYRCIWTYKLFLEIHSKNNTWDYSFFLESIVNKKTNIIPKQSLVQNIGFDQNATFTTVPPKKYYSTIDSLDITSLLFKIDILHFFGGSIKISSIFSFIKLSIFRISILVILYFDRVLKSP